MSRLLKSLSLAILAFGVIFPTTVHAHIDSLNKSIQYDQPGYSIFVNSLNNKNETIQTREEIQFDRVNALSATTIFIVDKSHWWKSWWIYAIISIVVLGIFITIYLMKNNQTKTAQTAAQAIRESEERYRTLFEHLPVGIIITALDSQLVAFNHVFQQMTGYSDEELQKIKMIDTYQDSQDRVRLLAQVEKEGSVKGFESIFKHKNGSYINVSLTVTPISLTAQPCFLSVVEDITNRKRVEDALEKQIIALTQPLDTEHEINFQDILSLSDIQQLQDLFAEAFGVAALITTPDGIPITQPSNFSTLCGCIIRTSEIGSRNCNISDAIIGRHNIAGPNIQPCLSAGLCNAGVSITIGGRHIANWLIGQVRNEAQDEEEIMKYAREIGADEDAFRAAYREVPTMSQEQFERVAHFLFVLANQVSTTAYQNIQQARFITERKQIEDELREAHEELEDRVKERTAQLEAANKDLESFTYSVSHDLRAPLRSMDGFSRILCEDYGEQLPPDAKRYLDLVRDGATKMACLVDDLLAFSRLGKHPFNKNCVSMENLVEQTINGMEAERNSRQIQITVGTLPDGEGDESLLRQVWVNLISNAIKFTRNCEVAQIEIGCIENDGRKTYYVKDNGAGFDMQFSNKLFGVFQRLHSEREFEGTGVGLAIVHRIIERHGGRVWAEGEVDKGATFYFMLG